MAILSLHLLTAGAFAGTPQTEAPATKTQPPAGKAAAKATAKASGKTHSTTTAATKHHRSKANSSARRGRGRAQRAPTPERISEIQSALAASGHYSGQPSGKWDASTIQSMKHYQTANGLPATGKLDAHTLQKLGLGSPIAGVAAPRPPAAPAAGPAAPTVPPPHFH